MKVDAAVGTSITSTAGCPCDTGYFIQAVDVAKTTFLHQNTNVDVAPSVGGGDLGAEVGAVSAVFAVPTASTQTFKVWATRPANSTGAVTAYADLTAIVAPFGSLGGNTLSADTEASTAPPPGPPASPPVRR